MSFKRIAQIESELVKLERERKNLLKSYENLTPEQRFATVLHDTLCNQNHTDGCGWDWESWNTVESTHAKKRYLSMAQELITRGYDEDTALEFISIIKGY
tara:strand:+ start:113 stop:412 length:300 start_codon:yes stop_codon:yes gene_type:complete